MKNILLRTSAVALATGIVSTAMIGVNAQNNPYPGSWNNCTWSCWELVKSATGIEMPSWGNAREWYGNAKAQGWAVGSTPAAGAVAVYDNHVVYVSSYDGGDQMYVQEGGYLGTYHEGYVPAWTGRGTSLPLIGFIYLTSGPGEASYSVSESQPYVATDGTSLSYPASAPASTVTRGGISESYKEKQERKEADEVINVDAAGASENEVSVSSGARELLEVPESVSESSEGEISVSFSSVKKLEAPEAE